MLGLGWFRLRCGEDGAGLVEVAAFVGGDGVEASGERETEKFEEGILEADGGEIEVGVGAQEILGVDVRGEERGGDVGQLGSGVRLDRLWRFGFHFGRRLESGDELCTEEAGKRGAAAEFVVAACRVGHGLHRGEVDSICEREVIEAFGDAPCGGMGSPGGLVFGEIGDEGLRVGLCGGVGVIEILNVGMHAGFSVARKYRRVRFDFDEERKA
jgi:hypothetical protein